ncbi:hypothetical protein SAMN07250955_11948 [Arboricoccus pini]|uniref:N,N-dimethylformamidase alpha subunit domain-containing protein n=1 Tax=Arboricoccus pini TaxID=1963835 RepID=A0A212S148_9PROT|nr:N,N-dimethylformamidase, small subunit [Arboricoccus pini]SNB78809.1 hypothetical protein SAMN07250955_11948 [Arboricoccus pini]
MITIPGPGTPERQRLIDEHERCIRSMKGVAGCAILRCGSPGDTTSLSGGITEDPLLRAVLQRMRGQPTRGKLVAVCTKVDAEWRIARLSGVPGVPPRFVDECVFTDEQEVQHAIFLRRLDEMAAEDGMPEHFDEGWKRGRHNWL